MRTRAVVGLLIALAGLTPLRVESQIGGLIKKKAAEAAKGKAANKTEDASTAQTDSCGPLTPEKLQGLLRGLQTEGAARNEFDSRVAREQAAHDEAEPRVKACRDAATNSVDYQKAITEGFSGPNPPSTPAAVQDQMAKNKAKWDETVDKKCGKVPPAPSHDPGDIYKKAHAAGAKDAGMSEYCYDVFADRVIAFCRLKPEQQKAAVDKGIRVDKATVFTADEAKAIQPHCNELFAALKKAGSTMVP